MNHHAGLSTVPTSGEDPECDCTVTSGRRLSASHPSRRHQQSLELIKQDCVNTLSMKTNDGGNRWKVWNALNALNVCLFHSQISWKMVTFEWVGVNMVLSFIPQRLSSTGIRSFQTHFRKRNDYFHQHRQIHTTGQDNTFVLLTYRF